MDDWICRDIRGIRTTGSYRAWQCMYDAAGLHKIADTETVVENQDVTRLVTEAVARRLRHGMERKAVVYILLHQNESGEGEDVHRGRKPFKVPSSQGSINQVNDVVIESRKRYLR